MNFAVVRGTQFLRYEHDDKAAVEPGCRRYPVEVAAQPEHDPEHWMLESAPAIDTARGVVVIVYTAVPRPQLINPPSLPGEGQTIIQQADTSGLEAQVAALQAMLAQMQQRPAYDMESALLATVAIGARDGDPESIARLEPIAAKRGLTVPELIEELIAARIRATEQALKGAA